MTRKGWLRIGTSVVVVAAGFGLWLVGWPAAPANERLIQSSVHVQNLRLILVPVAGPPAHRRPALEVWRDLFSEMAADGATGELLRKLYGGVRVELVVATPTVSEPPASGVAVALRVQPAQPGETEWAKIVARMGGREDTPVECLLGMLSFSRVTQFRMPVVKGEPSEKVAKFLEEPPSDMEALLLAVNDSLLRRQVGWKAINGQTATLDQLRAPLRDVATARAELDGQIAAWCKQYAP